MKNPTDERLAELTDKLENGIKELYWSAREKRLSQKDKPPQRPRPAVR